MTLKTKITTAIATGAVLLNALAPAAFATTLTVTGNSDSSQNHVDVSNTNSTAVTQTNTSTVTNNVSSTAETGGNSASRNTGGNSSVDTGDATSNTSVTTAANTNAATVANCNCGGDTNVTVSGNGTNSNNSVDLDNGRRSDDNATVVNQTNTSTVDNEVSSNAQTGGNSTDRNTGGSSSVSTGDAKSVVDVTTQTNVNAAQVGNSDPSSADAGLNVSVSGNGDSSHNSVDLDTHNSVELTQTNSSDITNKVSSNAKTGNNDADRNTGGNVKVDTGNATAKATVTNEPNFNAANVDDCGCTTDLTADISKNGVDTHNFINADMGNELTVDGTNGSSIDNEVTPTAKTGGNDADRNTGAVVGIDPSSVTTGDALDNATVTNSGNSSTFGQPITLPSMGNVDFTTDFQAFWAMWMSWAGANQG